MTKHLLLVDVDNLLSGKPGVPPAVHHFDRLPATANVTFEEAEVVIAFALNLDSARSLGNDAPVRLLTLASQFATLLQSANFLFECVLVPSMPQTVDAALERLLESAVFKASSGVFQQITVLTQDKGLRERVDMHLQNTFIPLNSKIAFARSWRSPTDAVVHRVPLEGFSLSSLGPCQPPSGWVGTIAVAEESRWVHASPDVPPGIRWSQLLDQIKRYPHLFSQFGATAHSFAGVRRLLEVIVKGEVPEPQVPYPPGVGIEAFGMEAGTKSIPVVKLPLAVASTGPGAVRCPGLTLHTRLSCSLLNRTVMDGKMDPFLYHFRKEEQVGDSSNRASLHDETLLLRPLRGPPKIVQVKLSQEKRLFRAEVSRKFGNPPEAWWIDPPHRTWNTLHCYSELRVSLGRDQEFASLGPVEGAAIEQVTCFNHVDLVAPFIPDPVILPMSVPAGRIVSLEVSALRCLLLSPRNSLKQGTSVTLRPIQDYPKHRLNLPPEFWRLPLLLPS